ncbi:Major Facilitator Superfamily protein [compost metagenome]
MRANGFISVSDQVVRCGGWALSGVTVAFIGSLSTLTVASCCYFIAILFTLFIRDPIAESNKDGIPSRNAAQEIGMIGEKEKSETSTKKESRWSLLSEGWIILGRNQRLRSLTIIDAVDTLGGTAWISVFLLAFVQEVLNRDESWWGIMNGAFFAGSIAGGLLVVTFVSRLQKRSYLNMLLALIVYVILTVLFAVSTNAMIALLILALSGLPVQVASVIRRTLIQQSVDAMHLPKVLAAMDVIVNLTFAISLLILAWFADGFGMVNLYLLAAALTTIAVVIGLLFRRSFIETEVIEPVGISHH